MNPFVRVLLVTVALYLLISLMIVPKALLGFTLTFIMLLCAVALLEGVFTLTMSVLARTYNQMRSKRRYDTQDQN